MPKINELIYRMKLRKSVKKEPIELLKITLEETKKEIEFRNTKKGKK